MTLATRVKCLDGYWASRRDAWKVNDTVKQKCCGTLDKYHLTRVARRLWHCLARRCPLMRAMNMPGVVPQAARMARNLGEFIQDAAVPGVLRFPAQISQTLELLFQRPQFPNTFGDMPDVLVQQRIDLATVLGRRILEVQKNPDLVERHVQTAAMPDERQARGMGITIDTVVAPGPGGFGQQAFAFVVANGFDLRLGQVRQFTDLHDGTPLFSATTLQSVGA